MSAWMWRRRQVWRCRTPTEQTLLLCNPLLPWVRPDFWMNLKCIIKRSKWSDNDERGVRCVGRKWTEAAEEDGANHNPKLQLVGLEPECCFFPLQEKIHKAFFFSLFTSACCCWRRRFWHMLANDDDWRDCGCFLWKAAAACVETKFTWQPTCLQSEF